MRFSITVFGLALLASFPCAASIIVAPNANAAANGNAFTTGVFFDNAPGGLTLQWALAASQFSSMPVGSSITGIGFRVEGGQGSGPPSTETFSSWDLQLSTSDFALGCLSRHSRAARALMLPRSSQARWHSPQRVYRRRGAESVRAVQLHDALHLHRRNLALDLARDTAGRRRSLAIRC